MTRMTAFSVDGDAMVVISTPNQDAALYVQLRRKNQKRHCELALAKVTVATMLGQGRDVTLTCTTTTWRSADEVLAPGVVTLLRAELGLSSPDLFSMTVTDYDLKRNRVFEAPPSTSVLLQYVDGFPSRRPEREREKKNSFSCSSGSQLCSGERVATVQVQEEAAGWSRRRLKMINSFQQQLSALSGLDCPMGRSQSQVEPLSRDAVNNLRGELKVSKDYFSMLVVGKHGDVKAWFPSPMWSLDNIYDLVDSLDLRVQEERLQASLGIHCPEDGRRRRRRRRS
ncbi:hypothetical protein CRUP_036198 [Coryphaenoides rupestris]|nr:hypothetical protein CRUP_036198 [Coryphaenoides rupestris]